MRRYFASTSTIILFLAIFGAESSPAASPAPKLGGTCLKIGIKATAASLNLICAKNGKKLKWVRVTTSSNQKPVETPPPVPASSLDSTTSLTPVSKYLTLNPVESQYGITWENIISKFSDISATAWLDAQKTIKRNQKLPIAGINFFSYVSPGALEEDPNVRDAEMLLKNVFTLYTRYPKLENVYFVALTTEEREATQKLLLATWGSVDFINKSIDAMYGINSNSPQGSVFSAPKCNGNDSGRNAFRFSSAAVILGVCPSLDGRDVHFAGVHAMAHEYVHMIQSAFMPGKDYGHSAPCWMFEGEPEWTQAAVSEKFEDYLKAQNFHPYQLNQLGLNYADVPPKEWTAAEVAQYLNESIDRSNCFDSNLYAYSYSLGAATTEALVSIGGSESVFALHHRFIDRVPYEQAFKEVYGITWEQAVPILSQIVAKKITLSWTSTALTYQTRP